MQVLRCKSQTLADYYAANQLLRETIVFQISYEYTRFKIST
jgi:hypothetical protein